MYNCFITPLDMAYSPEIRKGIRQAVSVTTQKTLCIIGNAEGGKSTLTAALEAESSFFLGRIVNCHMQAREWMTIANKQLALKQLPMKARSMEKCSSLTLLASMNTMAHTSCSILGKDGGHSPDSLDGLSSGSVLLPGSSCSNTPGLCSVLLLIPNRWSD